MTTEKPALPLIYRDLWIDGVNSLTLDCDGATLSEDEVNWINEQLSEVEQLRKERDIAVNALKELGKYGSSAGSGMCKIIKAANAELEGLSNENKNNAASQVVEQKEL